MSRKGISGRVLTCNCPSVHLIRKTKRQALGRCNCCNSICKAAGLTTDARYKTKCADEERLCRTLSVPRSSGQRGHVYGGVPTMADACGTDPLAATNGILADSYGEADTGRPLEYLARSDGGLRAGHRPRSPRATQDSVHGVLRVLDALRRSPEFEHLSGLFGLTGRVAGAGQ